METDSKLHPLKKTIMKHKWLLLLLLPVHVMAGELELKTSIKDN